MPLREWPIRARLTASFVIGLAVVLLGFGSFVYVRTSDNLLTQVDAGIRSRAQVIAAGVGQEGPTLAPTGSDLLERDEAFAQITDAEGRVLESSAIVAGKPLVPADDVAALTAPATFDERVPGIDNVTRVIAVPVDGPGGYVVLVGASLQDRRDQVLALGATLAAAGLVTLILAGLGAWWIVGAALRPVESMRQRADTISATGPGSRLPVHGGKDEIARLAETLNAMLDRIDDANARERELVDRASHELRTPLAIQRVGLDLALSGPDTTDALREGLRDASEENTHLTRLAADLLILSRARGGQLPVRRRVVVLDELIDDAVTRGTAAAAERGVALVGELGDQGEQVRLDPDRVRQILDNLIDNAIRATPADGAVTIRGAVADDAVVLEVEDTGPGFDDAILESAFEPFARAAHGPGDHDGAGLGLSIVKAITESHDGSVEAANTEYGALVTIVLH